MERTLMKGNEAMGEAALRAGCRFYFGYPITPQNELLEYMAGHLPAAGGVFLQCESEVAGINMVYGAAAAGKRAMISSSSPGISLMQEGLSFLASAELPALVVNISRGSPGLGRITPAQSDYLQAVKGGGHGDYNVIVLAPSSVQEMADLTVLAFELADKYHNPAMILGDGIVGQMMESVTLPEPLDAAALPAKPWAAVGSGGGERHLILSAPYTNQELVDLNVKLQAKYARVTENEQRAEAYQMDDAEYAIVAFGISSRLSMAAVDNLRAKGHKVGLIRPITLWPFPTKFFRYPKVRAYLTVEMNEGQMVQDVRLTVNGAAPVHFHGRGGGWVPSITGLEEQVLKMIGGSRS
ncbi:MAG: 3-methyl-2-oxobutanoate dehydrogenase subunit VorB [Bacillota bacterium]